MRVGERIQFGFVIGATVFVMFLLLNCLFAALAVTTVRGPWWFKYEPALVLAAIFGLVSGLGAFSRDD